MQQYYLGLDMGTNSVGWAVTNPQYELLRAKGKNLWGLACLRRQIPLLREEVIGWREDVDKEK